MTLKGTFGAMSETLSSQGSLPYYLNKYYRWAYVTPRAQRFWDKSVPINAVLFGNYSRLRDAVLDKVPSGSRVVQLGACYGDLTPRLNDKAGKLTVVDCVQSQLDIVKRKCDARTVLSDAKGSSLATGSADVVVMFFLLHELPHEWKQKVLTEAYRIAGVDGKVVFAEFDKPHFWNPFGYIERLIFKLFEPFAKSALKWRFEAGAESCRFGGLYRIVDTNVITAQLASEFVAQSADEARACIQNDLREPASEFTVPPLASCLVRA